jgi:hypothetical protein
MANLSRIGGGFHEEHEEHGEEHEEHTRGTLKNKPNHTSTRLANTQDPHGYMNNKRKIQGKVHLKSKRR